MSVFREGSQQNLTMAALIFNKMLHDFLITGIIKAMPEDMDYINIAPMVIAEGIIGRSEKSMWIRHNFPVLLTTYRSRWPWSSAYARTFSGDYGNIQLNARKIKRSNDIYENLASLVGSIAHEWGHCLEYYWREKVDPAHHFNHGNNTRKPNTFQYQLGMKARAYLRTEDGKRLIREVRGN